MHAALLRDDDLQTGPSFEPLPTPAAATATIVSRYGEGGRRLSLPCLSCIIGAHLFALWALVAFDVIAIKPKVEPTVVTLVPEQIAPPPQAEEVPEPEVKAVAPPIVAPPPIVQTNVITPPTVAVSPTPPPPVPMPVVTKAAEPAAAAMVPPSPLAGKGINTPPRYPIEARRKHWEGTVRLRVLVGLDGYVKTISVQRSSGHEVLDEEALKVVAKWKFQVATRDGQPIEAVGFVPIPFVIKA